MTCCSKVRKLGRRRQEPSSRSKMSLCRLFCNNSYKVTTATLKNFLWRSRDENADTEIISLSGWIYCICLCRHQLPLVFDRIAHRTMRDPGLKPPRPFPRQGRGRREWVRPPHLLTWPNPTPTVRGQNWKVSSKRIVLLNMSFLSICPVTIKGGCYCKRCYCHNAGDAGMLIIGFPQIFGSTWRELRG